MRKRLLSILLSVCMVLTLLPTAALAAVPNFTVGSTEVTSGNVTDPGITTGTVNYDADTNTLTLNNATITTTNTYGNAIFKLSGDLNIKLIGSNYITIDSVGSGIKGTANLAIRAENMSIKGMSHGDSLAIVSNTTVDEYNNGIQVWNGLIENCTLNVTAGTGTGTYNSGSTGITTMNSLTIKNAVVTTTGGTTPKFSAGINTGTLFIEDSTVTANAGSGGGESYGIYTQTADGTVISASTVTATGNTSALKLMATPTITGLAAAASTDITGDGAAPVVFNASVYLQINNYKYVRIAPAAATPVIGTLTISDSFTTGTSLTKSSLDSKYKPTVTDNGVTITAEGWQSSVGSGSWTNWPAVGDLPLDTSVTYKLRYFATYSGGTVYSNAVTVTVVGNKTALALTPSPASPQSPGTEVTLTATLTGFFEKAPVTGQKIIFKNGTTALGQADLTDLGVAVFTWTPSDTGTYSLTAEYAATAYNTAATSEAVAYTVGTPSLPTASAYAVGAASGTDYELDTTNKILTIKTAKGAAFWSASGTSYLDHTILLESNVDVSGFSWTPLGDPSYHFTGTFDGQGHSITGLTASASFFSGLFGRTNGATIKNLCLSGSIQISNNSGSNSYGGALVAYSVASAITNCCSHTDITATSSGTPAGGSSRAYSGGLVGIADSGTVITNCFNAGSISAAASGGETPTANAGGIAGTTDYNSKIVNCYSVGNVTATALNSYAGGVVGFTGTCAFENCYYLGSAANKGIGGDYSDSVTVTGCGTIGSDKTTLTAGTADKFKSAQTLTYTATLLESLNGWVNAKASTDYRVWQADSGHINGGYPVLGFAWDPTGMSGVSCDVAAGTLTGTTTDMQYSLDSGTTWQDCAAGNTSGLTFAAGTVKVRQKDNEANQRTVITIAAPAPSSAPTLESKTYNSVTLTVMAGYEYSKDGGLTWQNSNLFSDLSSGTAYSFVTRIKATATTLPGTVSTALSVTTSNKPGDGTGSGSGTSSGTGAPVIVDGKTHNIGTEKKSGDTTTVTVDQSKLGTNIGGAASGSSVVVPVGENGSATASLVVKNIEDMAQKGMTLTVQTANVAYNLDTSAIDTAALTAAFPGADMSTVPFNVTITNSSVSVAGETLVLSPVSFTVTAAHNGQTVSVDTFSAFIDRVIEVTAEQAEKITTAVVVNADGSVRHVPTNVIEKDGKYYAVINSRTNSTYALIQNEVTFADAEDKWYEAAVNEMGSRKIIEGRSASVFDGEASITRAEFAAILIRALGLPMDGTSTFSDVPADAWYTGAVATAVKYGLTEGKGGNRFDPSAAITRQEAMLMLQRAAVLTEFTGTSGNLGSFADANIVSAWALNAAKWSVGSGLIKGTDGKLNPSANITRAESAVIILRLLQKAGLVDVRS